MNSNTGKRGYTPDPNFKLFPTFNNQRPLMTPKQVEEEVKEVMAQPMIQKHQPIQVHIDDSLEHYLNCCNRIVAELGNLKTMMKSSYYKTDNPDNSAKSLIRSLNAAIDAFTNAEDDERQADFEKNVNSNS